MDFAKEYAMQLGMVIAVVYATVLVLRVLLRKGLKRLSFIDEKKRETFSGVLINSSYYVAFLVVAVAALQPFVDIKQLMVAGGVLGIVIGFGAQSAIKDILYGFFFLFEGQMKAGDFVQVNGELEGGTIEELGFRAVKIRLVSGKLMTISNGEVKKVVNGNIEKRRVWESVIVSFREDPRKVKEILENVCHKLNIDHYQYMKKDEEGNVEEAYFVRGLSSLDHSPYGYRYSIVGTIEDDCYIEASADVKEAMAVALYEANIRMPEQQVFYQTRANSKGT